MLTSQLGIRLVLWVGKSVPRPAPYEALRALTQVVVTNDSDNGDGFQITFALSRSQPGDYSLIRSGVFDPPARVIIGVILGVTPMVLIDGVITHHQHSPNDELGQSTFTVTGNDVSVMLDLDEKNEKYENQTDSLIVTQMIGRYAKFGLVPKVTQTTDVPIMIDRIPRQCQTDLQFINDVARRNGFVFYIEPVSFGVNKAYWGPQNRTGRPQPALTLGQGPSSNLKSLHFTNDALAPVGAKGSFVEPLTKTAIPIPQLPSLRIPPMASSPQQALRTTITRDTANRNALQAATAALAASTNAPDSVTASGDIDTIRYGHVLRARKLVGISGAGASYDGNYYVRSVTHTITIGDYTQSFDASREGTGALLPVVTR